MIFDIAGVCWGAAREGPDIVGRERDRLWKEESHTLGKKSHTESVSLSEESADTSENNWDCEKIGGQAILWSVV